MIQFVLGILVGICICFLAGAIILSRDEEPPKIDICRDCPYEYLSAGKKDCMYCHDVKYGADVEMERNLTDMEKVFTGLECLITDMVPCNECPYDKKRSYCIKSIALDAKRLIEEQQKLIDEITQRRANNGAFD